MALEHINLISDSEDEIPARPPPPRNPHAAAKSNRSPPSKSTDNSRSTSIDANNSTNHALTPLRKLKASSIASLPRHARSSASWQSRTAPSHHGKSYGKPSRIGVSPRSLPSANEQRQHHHGDSGKASPLYKADGETVWPSPSPTGRFGHDDNAPLTKRQRTNAWDGRTILQRQKQPPTYIAMHTEDLASVHENAPTLQARETSSDTNSTNNNVHKRRSLLNPLESRRWQRITSQEDELLTRLKSGGLTWAQIVPHFPGRTLPSLQSRWTIVKASHTDLPEPQAPSAGLVAAVPSIGSGTSRHGIPYSQSEDDLLLQLRQQGTPWSKIPSYFSGRTQASLQVRWSSKVSHRLSELSQDISSIHPVRSEQQAAAPILDQVKGRPQPARSPSRSAVPGAHRYTSPDGPLLRPIYRRSTGGATNAQLAASRRRVERAEKDSSSSVSTIVNRLHPDAAFLRSCRHQELGDVAWSNRSLASHRLDLRNYAFEALAPSNFIDDASGDVATVAWSPDGDHFAAGSVVLTDPNSMQYNRPRNLLLGHRPGVVEELPHHHVTRPLIDHGVNSLQSMRQTQDTRLFTTVQAVQFSPDSRCLYAVSVDGQLSVCSLMDGLPARTVRQSHFTHAAPVDFLSVSRNGVVATGCRTRKDNIILFNHNDGRLTVSGILPSKPASPGVIVSPSALRWGVAPHQSKYILAGFAQTKEVLLADDDEIAGECCLFDGSTGTRIELGTSGSVFDVSWNPNFGHTAFAIASTPVIGNRVNHGMKSVVRLFGETNNGPRSRIELECPARDMNDVLYSPYDDNIIAAGSTDGKVYIWDTRYIKQNQDPQRVLTHGSCLSVLPHERSRWDADTGIRFLSFGANHKRLFSGSSDGVLKIWNPYVAEENAHVKDAATFSSAIMSGAFNEDHTSLLIGEDAGRLTLLTIEADPDSPPTRFDFRPARAPPAPPSEPPHRSLLASGQITFEPAGALPIRQAVQGPGYTFSRARLTGAEAEQYESSQRFQRDLWRRRNRWKRLRRDLPGPRVDPCALDCAFLPRGPELGDVLEVPDSLRSAGRVPAVLRGDPPPRALALRRGLVAVCARCGAPAVAPETDGVEALCERCGFTCFRCGDLAELSPALDCVRCRRCAITWSAGVLGYEIVKSTGRGGGQRMKTQAEDDVDDGEAEVEFGDAERSRLLDMAA